MNTSQITKTLSFIAFFFVVIAGVMAQDVTTVKAKNYDISNNLDLEAVASIFGDSKDLEDFEKRLNDPETKISNLDLNEDGYVDYLRIVEMVENSTHLFAIQAVLGDDQYQDVAIIEVEKDDSDNTYVQVVGDVYMYGPDFIIEPTYISRPVFFIHFWKPLYRPYRSTYYWGYYPNYFRYWHPIQIHRYRTHIRPYINVRHKYQRVYHRRSKVAARIHKVYRRNDYEKKHPKKSFIKRTKKSHKGKVSNQKISQKKAKKIKTKPNTKKRNKRSSKGK